MKRVAKAGAPYGAGGAARAARALWVYLLKIESSRGTLPFFPLEYTERGSQVKPLLLVPTASAARNKRVGLTRLPLSSCVASG